MSVHDSVNRLRTLDAETLRKLPSKHEEETVDFSGKALKIITWHDEPEPGSHRIVVAAYWKAMAGLASRIEADGFVVTANGEKRNLTEQELSPFQ